MVSGSAWSRRHQNQNNKQTMKMDANKAFLDEILEEIFQFLSVSELARISLVSKQWLRISRAREIWKRHVMRKWPSQRFLYENINTRNLEWFKVYQELEQKSWFSPDDMKYFICCKTFADELVTEELRQNMFGKIVDVAGKWLQVFAYEHDDNNYEFDKNAELYYDTVKLEWVFLDRRRGYIGDLFPSQKLKTVRKNKKIRHIRPYQVIPSCLVLYRWLCLFGSFASAEDGLTFYRIWRFKLKHQATGMIFEIYDWKAAMNTTFSNGMPGNAAYRNDALELLDILAHPLFIMHPLGPQPVLNEFNSYLACATAGGISRPQSQRKAKKKVKVRSPAFNDGKCPENCKHFTAICDSDDDNNQSKERRNARRTFSPTQRGSISSVSPRAGCSSLACEQRSYSSDSSALSDTEGSERESDFESECESPELGYIVNCEFFIIGAHSLDIEEQHSIQASISDGWMVTHKSRTFSTQVLCNTDDAVWYFSDENDTESSLAGAAIALREFQQLSPRIQSFHARSQSDNLLQFDMKYHVGNARRPNSSANIRAFSPEAEPRHEEPTSPTCPQLMTSFPWQYVSNSLNSLSSNATSLSSALAFDVGREGEPLLPLEAIPSCLALYRLICLFDLNCSMYKSEDDTSAWSVKMLHKKTGGIANFRDYNGKCRGDKRCRVPEIGGK